MTAPGRGPFFFVDLLRTPNDSFEFAVYGAAHHPRDSELANQLSLAVEMEPVRPQVDAYLLDWITTQPLKREWFFEKRDGNARLMASLTERLSQTAATWCRAVNSKRGAVWTKNRQRMCN